MSTSKPRRKRVAIDWVVMGPAPYFATCKRCGEHIEAPKLPMPISAFTHYSNYALELHRRCEVKP